jgi:hypothetical protein
MWSSERGETGTKAAQLAIASPAFATVAYVSRNYFAGVNARRMPSS